MSISRWGIVNPYHGPASGLVGLYTRRTSISNPASVQNFWKPESDSWEGNLSSKAQSRAGPVARRTLALFARIPSKNVPGSIFQSRA